MVGLRSVAEVGGVARLQIRCGARTGMAADTCRRCRAIVNGDGHVLTAVQLEVDGIRHGLAFSLHSDTSLTVEGQTDGR